MSNKSTISRRSVLAGAAAAGATTALAGCAASATSPDASPKNAPSETPSKAAAPTVVTTLDKLPVGEAVILLDAGKTAEGSLVLSRPTATDVRAISAICTHGRCPVSEIISLTSVECACHGSEFLVEDGSVLRGPATTPLAQVKVRIEGNTIVRD